MTTRKIIALPICTFVSKLMSLLFNTIQGLFISRSKHLLISWLRSPSALILEPKKIKSLTVSVVFWSTCHEVMRPVAMIFIFWMLSFKPVFSLSSFTFIKRFFSSSSLSAIRVGVICLFEVIDISSGSWFQVELHPAWHFTWCTLHITWKSRVTIYSLDILLSQFWTRKYCLLTLILVLLLKSVFFFNNSDFKLFFDFT